MPQITTILMKPPLGGEGCVLGNRRGVVPHDLTQK